MGEHRFTIGERVGEAIGDVLVDGVVLSATEAETCVASGVLAVGDEWLFPEFDLPPVLPKKLFGRGEGKGGRLGRCQLRDEKFGVGFVFGIVSSGKEELFVSRFYERKFLHQNIRTEFEFILFPIRIQDAGFFLAAEEVEMAEPSPSPLAITGTCERIGRGVATGLEKKIVGYRFHVFVIREGRIELVSK